MLVCLVQITKWEVWLLRVHRGSQHKELQFVTVLSIVLLVRCWSACESLRAHCARIDPFVCFHCLPVCRAVCEFIDLWLMPTCPEVSAQVLGA